MLTKFKMQIHCRSPYQRWTTSMSSSFPCWRYHVLRTFFVLFHLFFSNRNECRCTFAQTNNKKSVIIMLEQRASGEPLTKIIASTVQYALLRTGAGTNWTVDKWSTSPSDKMKNIYTFFLMASPPPLLRCPSSFFWWFCHARIRRHRHDYCKLLRNRGNYYSREESRSHFLWCDGLKSINSSTTTHEICFLLFWIGEAVLINSVF